MSDNDRLSLGLKLKAAREYLEISQEEAAVHLKIPRPAVSLIESGKRGVDALELRALADLYNVSVDSLTKPSEDNGDRDNLIQHLARATVGLSESDKSELMQFAEFLKARSSKETED